VTEPYRFFRRDEGAPSLRPVIAAFVAVAIFATTTAVIRVRDQHDVLRLGYQLARKTERVHQLREQRRQLEIEHARLAAPTRITRLAAELGMAPIAADKIRIAPRVHAIASRAP
jgi:cell division protein FtsL